MKSKKLSSKRVSKSNRPVQKRKLSVPKRQVRGRKPIQESNSKRSKGKVSQRVTKKRRYVAKYGKVPKSTSNIREASNNAREKYKKEFMNNVNVKFKKQRGWNRKIRNYSVRGLIQVRAYVIAFSGFDVESEARLKYNYRLLKALETTEKNMIFNELWGRTIVKEFGRISFDKAKELYAKLKTKEEGRMSDMRNRFNKDNREVGQIEKINFFKLVGR